MNGFAATNPKGSFRNAILHDINSQKLSITAWEQRIVSPGIEHCFDRNPLINFGRTKFNLNVGAVNFPQLRFANVSKRDFNL